MVVMVEVVVGGELLPPPLLPPAVIVWMELEYPKYNVSENIFTDCTA